METAEHFFDFAAEVGLTKHIGGLESTEELADQCHIGPGTHVLDVGCGAGVTPVYLVKSRSCKVVGVDISQRMIERSIERAKSEGLADRIEFRVADAQDLPYEDDLFDAVITESVTAFPADKQKAVNEYARVTKPGGYIGLNESTWLETPPPPEVISWVSQEVGAQVKPLAQEEWVELMTNAGLTDLVVRIYDVDTQAEAKGIVRRYGWLGMLRVFRRMITLYIKNPAYREFVKGVQQQGITPPNLDVYFGYGLYVGRK
jgi:ubiquinone/menaquinone biosynthesis C-methylase UbiE